MIIMGLFDFLKRGKKNPNPDLKNPKSNNEFETYNLDDLDDLDDLDEPIGYKLPNFSERAKNYKNILQSYDDAQSRIEVSDRIDIGSIVKNYSEMEMYGQQIEKEQQMDMCFAAWRRQKGNSGFEHIDEDYQKFLREYSQPDFYEKYGKTLEAIKKEKEKSNIKDKDKDKDKGNTHQVPVELNDLNFF